MKASDNVSAASKRVNVGQMQFEAYLAEQTQREIFLLERKFSTQKLRKFTHFEKLNFEIGESSEYLVNELFKILKMKMVIGMWTVGVTAFEKLNKN